MAENAFTHGFSNEKEKKLTVTIKAGRKQIHFQIWNNGPALDEEWYRQIELQIQSGSSHGLSMIYEKLTSAYGDNCVLKLQAGKTGGTVVTIEIPYKNWIDGEEEQLPIEIVGNAEDGEEAIQLIKETSPRLIFLDIHMPQKNGFQVIEEVSREMGAQIIVLTAFASFENAQQALRLGVSDILSKLVDFEQLKAAIFRAVGWKFTSNETVNLMLEYIHNHYKENMELEDLSKVTYSTESHLARLFKKHMGITILSYIHQLRIEEACRLLSGHECDIQEASFRVGYASLNNFYKYFKRYVGMTPAQFLEK